MPARATACLLLLLWGAACDGVEEPEPPAPSLPLEFFVAGHAYGAVNGEARGVHPPFRAVLPALARRPDLAFGFLTGDAVREATAEKFDLLDRDVARLGKPVHYLVGNHEARNGALFERRYGPPYRSFRAAGALFLLLDPNLDGWRIRGPQLDFVRRELAQLEGIHTIFVLHHQVLWAEPGTPHADIRMNSLEGRAAETNYHAEVLPLLSAAGRPVYVFAGDVGAFPNGSECVWRSDGPVQLIASGMGAGARDNFLLVRVGADHAVRVRAVQLAHPRAGELTHALDGCVPKAMQL